MQKQKTQAAYASTVASILNSAQITIFNMIYLKLAGHLTKLENHRTDTQYEDNMIVKIFSFTFVNSFAYFLSSAAEMFEIIYRDCCCCLALMRSSWDWNALRFIELSKLVSCFSVEMLLYPSRSLNAFFVGKLNLIT